MTIDFVPQAEGNSERALLVDFQFGRVEYHSVTELVKLTPGTYEFKGKYKGKLDSTRGLKWRVVCAGGAAHPVGESAMITGLVRDWSSVAFTFTVPETDCRAQYVRLDLDARMASEQMISGSMLFADLHIARVESPQQTYSLPSSNSLQRDRLDRRVLRPWLRWPPSKTVPRDAALSGLVPAWIAEKPSGAVFGACTGMLIASLLLGGGTRGGFLSDAILELIALPALLVTLWSLFDLPWGTIVKRSSAFWPWSRSA